MPASEMVWCGARKGRECSSRRAASQQPRDAMDLRGFDGFFKHERRQNARQPFG
jgi:hypothetical protein